MAIGAPTNYNELIYNRKLAFARDVRDCRVHLYSITEREKRTRRLSDHEDAPLLKLPSLDVPKVAGQIEKWSSFKGRFINLISDQRLKDHDNQKQSLLFQAVSGDALSLIENLKDSDFLTCWKILTQFYDDPLRRSKTHLDAIFGNTAPGRTLRQLLVMFRQHVSGFKAACSEASLDPLDQVIIERFLDHTAQTVRLSWEKKLTEKGSTKSLEDFFRFIESECLASERAGSSRAMNKPGSSRTPKKPSKRGHALVQVAPKKTDNIYCKLCKKKDHYSSKCPEFREMTIEDRTQFVKRSELCPVCFRKPTTYKEGNANPKKCRMRMLFCSVCKRPHNKLLHRKGK